MASILKRMDDIYQDVKHTRQQLGMNPVFNPENPEHLLSLRNEEEALEDLKKYIDDHVESIDGLKRDPIHVDDMDRYIGACWDEYHEWAVGQTALGRDKFKSGSRATQIVASTRSDVRVTAPVLVVKLRRSITHIGLLDGCS